MDTVLRTAEANERFGRGVVRHKVARKLWQRPCRGVVVLHNGPLSEDEHEAVALASACTRAALAGATALAHDGFEVRAEGIHVVLPEGARKPSKKDVITKWSTQLDDRDVHARRKPRRTRPARSVLDAASWSPHERFARWVVIAALQHGVVSTRQLREALTRRGPCRHRGIIVESVLDAAGGIQSLPERDFTTIWRLLGLPRPTRQRPVARADGRFYLDVWWEELGFGVEIHGIPHLAVERWDADLFRANEVIIGGDHSLAFSSYATRRQRVVVADQLGRMARAHGWTGVVDLEAFKQSEQHERSRFRPGRQRG